MPVASPIRVLLLEDSELDAELAVEELRRSDLDCRVEHVEDRSSYLQALGRSQTDVILSDFSLPGFDGAAALTLAREHAPGIPFIFVSGVLGEEFAIQSLKDGATDYVLKQRLSRLPGAVVRAVREADLRAERRKAEEQRKLLIAELNHRVKNTLATVAAMARLTVKQSESLETFEPAFMSRLHALSQVHSLIFEADWGETDFHRVISQALSPFAQGQDRSIQMRGPELRLTPKPALTLTLILHELVTNACKYGALSHDGGEVEVVWSVEPDDGGDRVRINWRERGGPPVSPPTRKGFGRILIERSARYELDGEAEMDFARAGLNTEIRFPAKLARA